MCDCLIWIVIPLHKTRHGSGGQFRSPQVRSYRCCSVAHPSERSEIRTVDVGSPKAIRLEDCEKMVTKTTGALRCHAERRSRRARAPGTPARRRCDTGTARRPGNSSRRRAIAKTKRGAANSLCTTLPPFERKRRVTVSRLTFDFNSVAAPRVPRKRA
jgi:hypothetical protein